MHLSLSQVKTIIMHIIFYYSDSGDFTQPGWYLGSVCRPRGNVIALSSSQIQFHLLKQYKLVLITYHQSHVIFHSARWANTGASRSYLIILSTCNLWRVSFGFSGMAYERHIRASLINSLRCCLIQAEIEWQSYIIMAKFTQCKTDQSFYSQLSFLLNFHCWTKENIIWFCVTSANHTSKTLLWLFEGKEFILCIMRKLPDKVNFEIFEGWKKDWRHCILSVFREKISTCISSSPMSFSLSSSGCLSLSDSSVRESSPESVSASMCWGGGREVGCGFVCGDSLDSSQLSGWSCSRGLTISWSGDTWPVREERTHNTPRVSEKITRRHVPLELVLLPFDALHDQISPVPFMSQLRNGFLLQ